MPSSLFPLLLVAHIALAVSLVLPSILLPFALRTRRAAVDSDSRVVQGLLYAQTHGTLVIGAGLAITGLGLIAALGSNLLQQPWLSFRFQLLSLPGQRYVSYLMAGLVGVIGFLMSSKPVLW